MPDKSYCCPNTDVLKLGIKNAKAEPMDNIRDEADACIKRILARRKGTE